MAAIAKEDLTPYNLGHLGLVGAFIRETGIIEKIDSMIPKLSNYPGNFTHGEVVALMILNGLGYTSRPLYMTHTFFEAKDVEAMLGIEYESSWFNDGRNVRIWPDPAVFRPGFDHHEKPGPQNWKRKC